MVTDLLSRLISDTRKDPNANDVKAKYFLLSRISETSIGGKLNAVRKSIISFRTLLRPPPP